MDTPSPALVIVLIVLIALSAFFSAAETAFNSVNKARIKTRALSGDRKAVLVMKLSDNYDKLLSTILIGNNIVNIAATSIATVLFVSLWPHKGALISTVVMTVFVLIFGEITPKSLAKQHPEEFALKISEVMNILNKLFTPLDFLLLRIKNFVSGRFGDGEEATITEDELMTIVDEAEEIGGIGEDESELLRNVLEFNDVEAGDILTPRTELAAVDKNASNDEVAAILRDSGCTRIPVYDGTIDTIVGILNGKDFYNHVYGTDKSFMDLVKKPMFVPPSVKISELMKTIQSGRSHMAIVVDEFGGTQGIVTLEDMLEELVGEIWDEHDEVEGTIVQDKNGTFLVPDSCDIDDFFDKFEIDEDENLEATTVNGWVMEHLEKVPELGDSFEHDNLRITVTETDGPKAEIIRVEVMRPKEKKGLDDLLAEG